jgi:bacterioferritin-associated ferredoxin
MMLVIVCVCNALRERQIREATRQVGRSCAVSVYGQLGCKVKCGQCLGYARQVMTSEIVSG